MIAWLARINWPTAALLLGALAFFAAVLWMLRADLEVQHALASALVVSLTVGTALARQLVAPREPPAPPS